MKPAARLFVKGYDGNACGPFRWTVVREWLAIGTFTPNDEVRLAEEAAWTPIAHLPELLAIPPGDEINDRVILLRVRGREKKPVGPRALAYLARLGCPVRPGKLNPFTAFEWVKIMEELSPHLADAVEHWAAEEESKGHVPAASPHDATAAQIKTLRSMGREVPGNLTWLQARRLISGPPTESQLRRLTFYGITLPEGACKDEAAERIDRHMRGNWATEEAYQASQRKRKALVGDTTGEGPPIRARLRQPPTAIAGAADSSPTPTAQPLATAGAAQQRTATRGRGRRAVYVASCLLLLGILVVAVARRRASSASTQTAQPVPRVMPARDAAAARLVTVLESPNQSTAEQLRRFAITLNVAGIMGGPEPRALIDGRMYRVGDVIDEPSRVVIVQVDPSRKAIVIGNADGAIVQRVLE